MNAIAAAGVEVWRPIPSYEGLYAVSNRGRVRSFYRDRRILRFGKDETGYPLVMLSKDGKRRPFIVHRLVALAFRAHGKNGLHCEVAHLDGDKNNPAACNLQWVSKVENESHKRAHGTRLVGEQCPYTKFSEAQIVELAKLILSGVGYSEAGRRTGTNHNIARDLARGKRWRHVMERVRAKQDRPTITSDKPRQVFGSRRYT